LEKRERGELREPRGRPKGGNATRKWSLGRTEMCTGGRHGKERVDFLQKGGGGTGLETSRNLARQTKRQGEQLTDERLGESQESGPFQHQCLGKKKHLRVRIGLAWVKKRVNINMAEDVQRGIKGLLGSNTKAAYVL